jgi:outer membrane immunogenic protein
MLRYGVLAIMSAIALAASAHAGDLGGPRLGSIKDEPLLVRPYLWNGFYIGANAGYGWGDDNGGNIRVFNPAGQQYASGPLRYDLDIDGAFAGLQAGVNRQFGKLVVGLEADIQTSGIDGNSRTSFAPPNIYAFDYRASLDIEWFATVRGRLGFAWDRTLIYVTGGWAFGEFKYDARYLITDPRGPGGFANLRSKDTETGYVLGAGIEHAFGPAWSLKAEYQFIDLGGGNAEGALFRADGTPTGERVKADFDTQFHTVRIGLNYHFHRDERPLK